MGCKGKPVQNSPDLQAENKELRLQLKEVNSIIDAIRDGEIDALLVSENKKDQVYILQGADFVYREIIEDMQEGYVTLSKDGVILFCNRNFARMMHNRLDQMIGRSVYEFFSPSEAKIFRQSMAGKDSFKQEFSLIYDDGVTVPVLVSVNFRVDQEQFAYMIITDLTEQKRSEQRFMHRVFEQAGETIIVCDITGTIIRVNSMATKVFGSGLLQKLFDPTLQLCRERDGKPFSIQGALQRGDASSIEAMHIGSDGRKRTFLVSAGWLTGADPGESIGFLVTLLDITQRKQAEEKIINLNTDLQKMNAELEEEIRERETAQEFLIESEARYRSVIDQASEVVLICDPDSGEILEANACFTQRLGYDLQKDGTLYLFELIMDDSESIRDLLARGGGIVPLQRRMFRHCRGNIVSVERTATLIHYHGRSLFVMTLRDVSEEVRREQEIQRDAQLATRVQLALLSVPDPSDHLLISTIFQPYGYVGGDLYFMDWRYDGSLLRGFLVDATGHGLGTALHTASLHVLLREVNERDLTLHSAMYWLNRRVGEYFDEGTFAGALGFELDLETRQLSVTCAGIPKVWIATKRKTGLIECPGMSLGVHEAETFDTHTIPIEAGDSVYFMTDGLSDMLAGQPELPVDKYPEMVSLLRRLSESEDRRDDATAVCIHIRSLPRSHIRQDGWPRTLRFNGFGEYDRMKQEVAKILEEATGKAHSFHEVVVSEALANAMECRDGVPRQHKATLRINKVGNRLIVRVKTSRIGFAGNALLKRLRANPENMFSFGEDSAMGRGIPLMLSLSDYMTYNSDGTEVLMAWKLPANLIRG